MPGSSGIPNRSAFRMMVPSAASVTTARKFTQWKTRCVRSHTLYPSNAIEPPGQPPLTVPETLKAPPVCYGAPFAPGGFRDAGDARQTYACGARLLNAGRVGAAPGDVDFVAPQA